MSDHYPVIFKVSVTYPNPNLLCDISNVSIGTQTACDSLTNTYTQQVTLTYSDAPSTGNLVVNNQAFPVTGSPQTVTLTNLTANGAAVDISAYFSDESLCAYFQSAAFTAAAACVTLCPLVINGVFDGTLAGGYPKGVELLALDNIPDLSIYSILVTFNGVSTSTITYTLPTGSLLAGEYYYVTNSLLEFSNFFGCTANFEAAISINGDDAVQVLCNGSVSDTFGDINVDGTGTAWEYLDGWASRVAGGPDGNTFILTNWSFGGVGALNGGTTNVTTNTPFPIQQCPATDCEITNVSAGTPSACNSVDNTYTVAITVEYINEPATGNLLIEGQSFAITTSPQTETITLTADGNAKNIWVQFSDDLNCGLLGTNLFTAPQACATISAPLVITGLYDGPLVGGAPKGVELYVLNDIPDLSIYGLGSANNGGGTDGQEFTFPAVSVSAGTCIFVASESIEFTNFFGFAPDYTSGSMAINGDDAIELFGNGEVIDVFGDINASGSGTAWDYLDGWVYRVDNTGPDGNVFNINNWTFSGINALDNETTNATAAIPYPTCTYSVAACEIDIILGNPADNSTDQSNNQSATNSIVASNSIVFSANLGLMMSYTAGNFLDFTEGFNVNADNNSLFEAKIQACSGAAKNEGVIKPIYIAPLTSLDIMVAPNPGHDIVHVFIKNLNSSAMLNLHDMMGNSIFRKSLSPTQNDISIALPQLPAGIYLLNVIEEKVQKFSRKIIIL